MCLSTALDNRGLQLRDPDTRHQGSPVCVPVIVGKAGQPPRRLSFVCILIFILSRAHPCLLARVHVCVCPQLDSPEVNGSLVCIMAEAAAKAMEHTLLLSLLLPSKSSKPLDTSAPLSKPAPRGSSSGKAAPSPVALEPLPTYRYGHTHGYEVLPAARTKSGGI